MERISNQRNNSNGNSPNRLQRRSSDSSINRQNSSNRSLQNSLRRYNNSDSSISVLSDSPTLVENQDTRRNGGEITELRPTTGEPRNENRGGPMRQRHLRFFPGMRHLFGHVEMAHQVPVNINELPNQNNLADTVNQIGQDNGSIEIQPNQNNLTDTVNRTDQGDRSREAGETSFNTAIDNYIRNPDSHSLRIITEAVRAAHGEIQDHRDFLPQIGEDQTAHRTVFRNFLDSGRLTRTPSDRRSFTDHAIRMVTLRNRLMDHVQHVQFETAINNYIRDGDSNSLRIIADAVRTAHRRINRYRDSLPQIGEDQTAHNRERDAFLRVGRHVQTEDGRWLLTNHARMIVRLRDRLMDHVTQSADSNNTESNNT